MIYVFPRTATLIQQLFRCGVIWRDKASMVPNWYRGRNEPFEKYEKCLGVIMELRNRTYLQPYATRTIEMDSMAYEYGLGLIRKYEL